MGKIVKILKCEKCGGTKFSFRWEFKNEEDIWTACFCHDGFGFQLTDAIIKCETCGEESEYELEDFLVVENINNSNTND